MDRKWWLLRYCGTTLAWLILASPAWSGPVFTDPNDDAVGIHDITSVNTRIAGGRLYFDITFADLITDPVNNPSDRDLFGFLDIDVDKNAGTGISPASGDPAYSDFVNARGGIEAAQGLGVDYYVDLSSLFLMGAGEAKLLNAADRTDAGVASVEFLDSAVVTNQAGTDSVRIGVLLADLLSSSGEVKYGFLAVDANGFSDEVLGEVSAQAEVVPGAATLTLAGAGLVCLVGYRAARKNRRKAGMAGEG